MREQKLYAIKRRFEGNLYWWNGLGWQTDFASSCLWAEEYRAVNYARAALGWDGKADGEIAIQEV